ncbi:MAG: M20/M25/M40 family metallo-hydrolase [Thiohalobacterales bacterium]|nr:M20/M25/M40 family metallo-hydrolase [Thiohalobacterales bacterium]
MRERFPRVFARLETETVNEHSLLLHWPGGDPSLAPILLTAHSDVVPVEPGTENDWERPAFAGEIYEGRIYGRGTLDDKQGLMAWLEAAETLLADGFEPQRTVVFGFGHDEEIGGREGARAIAQRLAQKGLRFAWMIDEGGLIVSDNPMLPDRPVAMINIAEKGYVTLTLVATGEGGHSSNPPRVSTIGRLAAALARLEDNPFPPQLPEPVEAMLETLAPHVNQPLRLIFSNLWLTGGLVASQMSEDRLTNSFVRTTTALTMFNAGVKENVVPQRAEARVNFRLLPGDTPEALVERVRQIVDDPEIEITANNWNNIPPVADHQGEGFTLIAEAIAAVYPEVLAVPSMLTATTDTRHYIDLVENQYRFHGVTVDSSQTTSIHGTNEYISTGSYLGSIDIARRILELAAGQGARPPL